MSRYTTKELIQQNNTLREKLNEDNKNYYEDLLTYMRMNSFFKNEKQVEEILLEILQDLLDAQRDGLQAEECFGQAPKETADEMDKKLGVSFSEIVKIFSIVFGINVAITAVPNLAFPETSINMIGIIGSAIVTLLAIFILFAVIKNSIYGEEKVNNKVASAVFGLSVVAILVVNLSTPFLTPSIWTVSPSSVVSVSLLFLLAGGYSWWVLKQPKDKKRYWQTMMVLAWFFAFVGLLNHWSVTASMMNTTSAKVVLIGSIIGFSLFIRFVMKREEKEKQETFSFKENA